MSRREFSNYVKAQADYSLGYLVERFIYDHESGTLFWRNRPRRHFQTESAWKRFQTCRTYHQCGAVQPNGYMAVRVDRKLLLVHRIAWVLYGEEEIPPGIVIDHINGDPTDNCISNLRQATKSQNGQNSVTKRDLPKGVYFDKSRGTYQVAVRTGGKRVRARAATLEQATALVRRMRTEARGAFTNHGDRNA